ncbi:LacI family DNA-binding transcriptional regulator [Arthrobacter sp. ATA002]|uniref:LacI family DNA-binding transcriptional regulator n=1 Tax=Arthrobacter sp. ATA002 TaxID=2991715 RepID=UPI0022A7969C|nr:LacI family DNA-binding transcriptional regulator [Arthrobacter sp. ATA002]WAP51938.1 LacI family DNA-binding transcriptional regulator [Arthrobacter sp. ATA002]
MDRRVTSTDVAQAAGVSRATVSYVLNGSAGQSISAATRERVLAAARQLGYTPSTAARTLRRGRSDLVLMLLPPEPLGRALAMIVDAASEQLELQGRRLVAHRLPGQGGAVPLVHSLAPAALILTTALEETDLAALRAAGIPVASLHETLSDPLSPDLGIGALQVRHLAEAGHRRIAVAVPPEPGYAWRVEIRLAAVREACRRHGMPPPLVGHLRLDAGEAAAVVAGWLDGPEPVTAACAFDDDHAFALLAGLAALGRRAPEDLAVIGAEDVPLAALALPPLTTVRVDSGLLGERFARMAVAGPPAAGGAELVSLVVRASA